MLQAYDNKGSTCHFVLRLVLAMSRPSCFFETCHCHFTFQLEEWQQKTNEMISQMRELGRTSSESIAELQSRYEDINICLTQCLEQVSKVENSKKKTEIPIVIERAKFHCDRNTAQLMEASTLGIHTCPLA